MMMLRVSLPATRCCYHGGLVGIVAKNEHQSCVTPVSDIDQNPFDGYNHMAPGCQLSTGELLWSFQIARLWREYAKLVRCVRPSVVFMISLSVCYVCSRSRPCHRYQHVLHAFRAETPLDRSKGQYGRGLVCAAPGRWDQDWWPADTESLHCAQSNGQGKFIWSKEFYVMRPPGSVDDWLWGSEWKTLSGVLLKSVCVGRYFVVNSLTCANSLDAMLQYMRQP